MTKKVAFQKMTDSDTKIRVFVKKKIYLDAIK